MENVIMANVDLLVQSSLKNLQKNQNSILIKHIV